MLTLTEIAAKCMTLGVTHEKNELIEVTVRRCTTVVYVRNENSKYYYQYLPKLVCDILVCDVAKKERRCGIFTSFLSLLEAQCRAEGFTLRLHRVVNTHLENFLIKRDYVLDGEYYVRWT